MWTYSLPIASQEVYDGRNLPMPAVSDQCVAIAYQTARRAKGSEGETSLVLVDKLTGRNTGTQVLRGAFEQSNRIELRGLGAALFAIGKSPPAKGTCLEILESSR